MMIRRSCCSCRWRYSRRPTNFECQHPPSIMSVIAGSVSAPLPQLPPDPHYNSLFFCLSLARQKPFAHHFLFLLCTLKLKILPAPRSQIGRGPAHSRTVRWTRDLQYVSRIVSSSTMRSIDFFSCFVHMKKIRIDAPHALSQTRSVAVRHCIFFHTARGIPCAWCLKTTTWEIYLCRLVPSPYFYDRIRNRGDL